MWAEHSLTWQGFQAVGRLPMHSLGRRLLLPCLLALTACGGPTTRVSAPAPSATMLPAEEKAMDFLHGELRVTEHRGNDDLLSAGLGLEGLRGAIVVPGMAEQPTAAELRRRAIQQNWRGIVDLSPAGGFGSLYGAVPTVPGREYHSFARIPGALQPHRLLAQVPDQFDRQARCLVVSPVSGSRGIYGAIGVGGGWGLPRGCAVVYTDKGAGTGFFDLSADEGVALDGRRARRGSEPLDFDPYIGAGDGFESRWPGVAIKHAHSADHPEADWGRHTLQALQFGLHALNLAFPAEAPFTPDNTQILGLAISNGGGALLRASELDAEGWFDAVIAGEPNILAPGAPALFDLAVEAAIFQPCAWLARSQGPQLASSEQLRLIASRRCLALQEAGLLTTGGVEAQAAEALARLRSAGWEDAALSQMGVLTPIDVWRAVVATYLQSYSRAGPAQPQCGYRFATLGPEREPQPTAREARALWWADASGVAPTAGIALLDDLAGGHDPSLPGLLCARAQRQSNPLLAASIEATRGNARPGSRVAIVHGLEDGLVPIAFSSRPYAQAAAEQGHAVRLYSVPHAQHFDAFLGIPALSGRQLPLLPYLFQAADHAWRSIVEGSELPLDQTVRNRLRSDIAVPLSGVELGSIK